jgi:hypothetical protein
MPVRNDAGQFGQAVQSSVGRCNKTLFIYKACTYANNYLSKGLVFQ